MEFIKAKNQAIGRLKEIKITYKIPDKTANHSQTLV
jgi:hypothetical protein